MPDTEQTAAQTPPAQSPWEAQTGTPEPSTAEERPEIFVGAALVGGFVLAQILKRLGEDD